MITNAAPTSRLQELRESADMSRAGLADLCGVGEHQVRRWEMGETLIPTRQLPKLLARFGVTSDHLLGLDREPTGKAA